MKIPYQNLWDIDKVFREKSREINTLEMKKALKKRSQIP